MAWFVSERRRFHGQPETQSAISGASLPLVSPAPATLPVVNPKSEIRNPKSTIRNPQTNPNLIGVFMATYPWTVVLPLSVAPELQ